jgi:hypothetical protein
MRLGVGVEEPLVSRTHKDEHSKKTATLVLEVFKNSDGTYEVFYKGELVRTRVPEHWLYEELCVGFGFCGDEYEPIIRQLNDSGKATLVL